ncbi:MAG: PilZ domain-containing protein [Gammaproteobacteria bacterium]
MAKTAKIYRLPTAELATESLESTIENVEIEHIELKVADGPAKNDKCQREHTRVEHGEIKARFVAKSKRLRPFTRVFPCEVMDISMGGACIQSTKRLYENETITLYFSPQGEGSDEIPIVGEVVRATDIDKTLFQYGIQFLATIPQGELQTIICRKAIEKKVRGDPESVN